MTPMPTDARSWAAMVHPGRELATEATDAGCPCAILQEPEVERIAGKVVALGDLLVGTTRYGRSCVPGIPTVTLTCTVQDSELNPERVDALAGFGLEELFRRWS